MEVCISNESLCQPRGHLAELEWHGADRVSVNGMYRFVHAAWLVIKWCVENPEIKASQRSPHTIDKVS